MATALDGSLATILPKVPILAIGSRSAGG